MKKFLIVILVCNTFAGLNQGNAFKAFFWFNNENDSLKHGCYGYTQIDSVNISSNEENYVSSFWLTYEWWFLRFSGAYSTAVITFKKTKPEQVARCSGHFENTEWFSGFKLLNSTDSLRFFFPLLPQEQNYGRYDYFTIDVDDSLDLEFYGAGDSIMVGTFVHKKPDARGAVNILGRNAFIVELTKGNPLRIRSIRCQGVFDSLIAIFLKFPLDTLKKDADWYGIDIIDTLTNVPKIAVHSVDLEKPHLIGSNKNIVWKLENKSGIDSCLIQISFDQMTWEPLGTTLVDTTWSWIISPRSSPETIIKVIACGKRGEYIASTKTNLSFYTLMLRSLQIH